MAQQVTVTGGTGFIASTLIAQLLGKGYTVNATVRSAVSQNPKIQHLHRLSEALPGTLRLFEADLLKEDSFNDAIRGSAFVFHTASPVGAQADDPLKDFVEPAVKGTKNVLATVAKSRDTVRRVVLTSSFAAPSMQPVGCMDLHSPSCSQPRVPENGQLFTEEDWNAGSKLPADGYSVSKTKAETAAWEWSEAEGISRASINPTYVIGPVPRASDSLTPTFLKKAPEGSCPNIFASFVDVRDVARAHVLAAEVPNAKGRYIVGATAPFNTHWLFKVLRKRFPQYELPEGDATHEAVILDNSKVQRELGLTFLPMSEMVADGAASLISLGLAKPKLKGAA